MKHVVWGHGKSWLVRTFKDGDLIHTSRWFASREEAEAHAQVLAGLDE